MDQHYFNVETLHSVMTRQAGSDETVLGFVFTPGFDKDGNRTVFAFPRVKNNTTQEIYLKEITEPAMCGCPYPPPCDPPDPEYILKNCYTSE